MTAIVSPANAGAQVPGTEAATLVSGSRRSDGFVTPANAGSPGFFLAVWPMRTRQPCVYLLANRRNGTLYVGVTSNLIQRVWQHRNHVVEGFTRRYRVHMLVWYEMHATMHAAITREKTIKGWRREWKLDLIEQDNPQWRDLYEEIA